MKTSVQITLIIVAAVLLIAIGISAIYLESRPGTTVNVNGAAEIKAVPDLVSIYFSIDTTASDAKTAKDKNAEIYDAVQTALIKTGLESKDIETEGFSINPEYDWTTGSQKIKDYIAAYSIRVQISTADTGKIGDILDAGVNAGALVNYINFELSLDKQNQYKAQALEQATQDARIKAESIANGLGKQVGSIVSVSDSSFNYNPWPIYANSAAGAPGLQEAKAATTNIQPGEQTIDAGVSIMYKLV